jgi:hypothetical protein
MATRDPLDGTTPSSNVVGRSPALTSEHSPVVHDIATERAQASWQEIADELYYRCGLRMCDTTIRRALRAQGIARLKPVRQAHAEPAEGSKRYGYTAAHPRLSRWTVMPLPIRPFGSFNSEAGFRLERASIVKIPEQSDRARPSQCEVQTGAMLGLKSFASATTTVRGVKLMHPIRKGQFDLRSLATQGQTPPESWAAVLAA